MTAKKGEKAKRRGKRVTRREKQRRRDMAVEKTFKRSDATQVAGMNRVLQRVDARLNGVPNISRRLAEAMVLPASGSIRFPTTDLPRTSVSNTIDQRNTTSPTVGYNGFLAGDTLVAFFGQSARMAMYWGPLEVTFGNAYFVNFNATATIPSLTRNIDVPATANGQSVVNEWFDPAFVDAMGNGPHGNTQCVGVSDGHSYLWMNTNDNVIFTVQSTSFNTKNFRIGVKRYVGDGTEPEDIGFVTMLMNATGGSATYTHIHNAGYIAFIAESVYDASTAAVAAGTLQCSMVMNYAATTGWAQVSCADFDPNDGGDVQMLTDSRVNAASMLITNVSSVLNRQGRVVAARVRQTPFWQLTPATLGRSAEHYHGDAMLGCYTFFEFSGERQKFKKNNNGVAPVFDLDVNDFYHFVQISNPTPSTTPNNYAMKFDSIVEFKSDISRYQKATSPFTLNDLLAAQRVINTQPVWFYENPTHAQRLYGLLKSAFSTAVGYGKKVAPYALSTVSAMHPELAPLMQGLRLLV